MEESRISSNSWITLDKKRCILATGEVANLIHQRRRYCGKTRVVNARHDSSSNYKKWRQRREMKIKDKDIAKNYIKIAKIE
jgi:hypothetical protein